jgi:ribosomal protein L32
MLCRTPTSNSKDYFCSSNRSSIRVQEINYIETQSAPHYTISHNRSIRVVIRFWSIMASPSQLLLRRIALPPAAQPLYSFFTRPLLATAISINIPGFLSDLWEGILNAVPKKKTSHMKKRHRQLAGKALKDVTAVVNCPGCGKPKRAHLLCPHCLNR